MEDPEKETLTNALLSGLLKWEKRRIQEYETAQGRTPAEKETLLHERRLETFFLLKRALHPEFYQLVARRLASDRRWDAQRRNLLREALSSVVSPTGTIEPGHHTKNGSGATSRRAGGREHQRRYYEYFPEFFFELQAAPRARGRDRRFLLLSTVFSPLDIPGEVPKHSPFFVLDPSRVATIRFEWTAQIIPGTVEFVDDLLRFREEARSVLAEMKFKAGGDARRLDLVHGWLTKFGAILVGFRAQFAAIASVQWYRRLSAEEQNRLIHEFVPLDRQAMIPERVLDGYLQMGASPEQARRIIENAGRARRAADAWAKNAGADLEKRGFQDAD